MTQARQQTRILAP